MAPETVASLALAAMIEAEFAAEGFKVKQDKLHGSVGHLGTTIGVYPQRTASSSANRYVSEMTLVVQFYAKYTLKIDPEQAVNPAIIAGFADRFRNALRTANPDPNTSGVWYFTLDRVDYVPDPTGNISRFEATLVARGNNGALIQETGA